MHINGEHFSVKGYIVSIPFAIEGVGGKRISTFSWEDGTVVWKTFLGGRLDGKEVVNFWREVQSF